MVAHAAAAVGDELRVGPPFDGFHRHGLVRLCFAIVLLLLWTGCASPGRSVGDPTPATKRPAGTTPKPVYAPSSGVYVVKAGDTLYAIARRFGLNMKVLARNNGLREPYTIYPGQRLRLRAARAVADSRPRTPATNSRSRSQPKAATPVAKKPAASPQSATRSGSLVWRWATTSPLVREYGGSSRGLDFVVRAGGSVAAAAPGEVVYAGSGLGGYERLVIVKHNKHYLSAYSLNQPFAVREGQQVRGGDRIASVGQGSAKARTLHFEIRRDGNPISPKSLLRRR